MGYWKNVCEMKSAGEMRGMIFRSNSRNRNS